MEKRAVRIPDTKRNHRQNQQDSRQKPKERRAEFSRIARLFLRFDAADLRDKYPDYHACNVFDAPKTEFSVLHRGFHICENACHHRTNAAVQNQADDQLKVK